jgi:hypothetical protein
MSFVPSVKYPGPETFSRCRLSLENEMNKSTQLVVPLADAAFYTQ